MAKVSLPLNLAFAAYSKVDMLSLFSTPHVLRVRDRWLKQHEVSARFARVEPDDRMTLCGKCETLWLAIQIAEPPCIAERRGAAPRREIIEPHQRGGLVTEQIEATIWTYREAAQVLVSVLLGSQIARATNRWRPLLIDHRL